MKFAYADPPYYGCSVRLYGDHPEAHVYDSLDGHRLLIERLQDEFPDGWALSMTSGNLHDILPLCPKASRVMAWTKPFAIFKPNVGLAYAWEPVVFWGGRKIRRDQPTVRDWCAVNITLKKGLTGAKPKGFCDWLFDAFNTEAGDELHDLFPGSGAVTRAWEEYRAARGWDLV
jgi:hypothetical protein